MFFCSYVLVSKCNSTMGLLTIPYVFFFKIYVLQQGSLGRVRQCWENSSRACTLPLTDVVNHLLLGSQFFIYLYGKLGVHALGMSPYSYEYITDKEDKIELKLSSVSVNKYLDHKKSLLFLFLM